MKIVVIFCIIFLSSIPIAFGQQYYDNENKYRITPPADWSILEQQDENFGKIVFFISNEDFQGTRAPFFMIIRIIDDNIYYTNFLDEKKLQEDFVQEFVRIGLIKDQIKQVKIDSWNFDEVDDGYIFEIHGDIIQEDTDITKYSTVGYILKSNEILGVAYYASPDDYYHSYSEFFESVQSFQYEERIKDSKIPQWIRTNAQWWYEGKIDEQDFLLAIQYLISEDIMKIPETEKTLTNNLNKVVPSWIKNTAGWWAQGTVSDDEFVNSIKFLIEKGIIKV